MIESPRLRLRRLRPSDERDLIALDSDPDLHLIVDGEILPAQRVLGSVYRFDIPADSTAVWLASRSRRLMKFL